MSMPLLCEMQAEMAIRFDEVDKRMAAMEEAQGSFRHALRGDSLMSKLVTGDFQERIEALEKQVREFQDAS